MLGHTLDPAPLPELPALQTRPEREGKVASIWERALYSLRNEPAAAAINAHQSERPTNPEQKAMQSQKRTECNHRAPTIPVDYRTTQQCTHEASPPALTPPLNAMQGRGQQLPVDQGSMHAVEHIQDLESWSSQTLYEKSMAVCLIKQPALPFFPSPRAHTETPTPLPQCHRNCPHHTKLQRSTRVRGKKGAPVRRLFQVLVRKTDYKQHNIRVPEFQLKPQIHSLTCDGDLC